MKYTCGMCEYGTESSSNWNRHLKSNRHRQGGKPKVWECKGCKFSTDRKDNYNRHMKSVGHLQAYGKKVDTGLQCDICNKTFSRKDHLKRHMAGHQADREVEYKYQCTLCDLKLRDKSALERHSKSQAHKLLVFADPELVTGTLVPRIDLKKRGRYLKAVSSVRKVGSRKVKGDPLPEPVEEPVKKPDVGKVVPFTRELVQGGYWERQRPDVVVAVRSGLACAEQKGVDLDDWMELFDDYPTDEDHLRSMYIDLKDPELLELLVDL